MEIQSQLNESDVQNFIFPSENHAYQTQGYPRTENQFNLFSVDFNVYTFFTLKRIGKKIFIAKIFFIHLLETRLP